MNYCQGLSTWYTWLFVRGMGGVNKIISCSSIASQQILHTQWCNTSFLRAGIILPLLKGLQIYICATTTKLRLLKSTSFHFVGQLFTIYAVVWYHQFFRGNVHYGNIVGIMNHWPTTVKTANPSEGSIRSIILPYFLYIFVDESGILSFNWNAG